MPWLSVTIVLLEFLVDNLVIDQCGMWDLVIETVTDPILFLPTRLNSNPDIFGIFDQKTGRF